MDNKEIQERCNALLEELGVPGFIVFGWQKKDQQYGIVYSTRKTPANIVVKGMSWALHDYASKKM